MPTSSSSALWLLGDPWAVVTLTDSGSTINVPVAKLRNAKRLMAQVHAGMPSVVTALNMYVRGQTLEPIPIFLDDVDLRGWNIYCRFAYGDHDPLDDYMAAPISMGEYLERLLDLYRLYRNVGDPFLAQAITALTRPHLRTLRVQDCLREGLPKLMCNLLELLDPADSTQRYVQAGVQLGLAQIVHNNASLQDIQDGMVSAVAPQRAPAELGAAKISAVRGCISRAEACVNEVLSEPDYPAARRIQWESVRRMLDVTEQRLGKIQDRISPSIPAPTADKPDSDIPARSLDVVENRLPTRAATPAPNGDVNRALTADNLAQLGSSHRGPPHGSDPRSSPLSASSNATFHTADDTSRRSSKRKGSTEGPLGRALKRACLPAVNPSGAKKGAMVE